MVLSSEFDQKGFQVTLVDFIHLQCYIQTSVKYKSTGGFHHESVNQWVIHQNQQCFRKNNTSRMSLVHCTQFISNPCYHETKQQFTMGEITTRYFIKTNSVSFKFHQHVVLCITGRFYTILTEPPIINKTTSELRVRKNNHQAIHQSQWCFIPNYTQGLLLVAWVDFTLFRSNPVL